MALNCSKTQLKNLISFFFVSEVIYSEQIPIEKKVIKTGWFSRPVNLEIAMASKKEGCV